jgi:hypothetical protein
MADLSELDKQFPDLMSVPPNQSWLMEWEGPVSADQPSVVIDGPAVRHGAMSVSDGQLELRDGGQPFCRMGLEAYDIIDLVGCNPTRGDADCSVGESCFVHPRAPSDVGTGMCLPADRQDELAGACEGILTSLRQYSVAEVYKDRMTLIERRRAVRTTPVNGCMTADECVEHYAIEVGFTDPAHPIEQLPVDEIPYSFSCEIDPSRADAPPRCLMTCETSEDCESGYSCSGGYCVSGPIPADECVDALQRYRARVGEAFAVLGSRTGFLHDRIADPDTGECVADPEGNPLSTGRLPLTAPPCSGDGVEDVMPNPCSTTTTHADLAPVFELDDDGLCVPVLNEQQTDQQVDLVVRDVDAIRFSNPSFTMHMVDPRPQLDLECNRDRRGEVADYRAVFPGFRILFDVVGGFTTTRDSGGFNQFALVGSPGRQEFLTYPAGIRLGPWGRLWILDQGDRTTSIRSQVVWLSPTLVTDDPTSSPVFYLR